MAVRVEHASQHDCAECLELLAAPSLVRAALKAARAADVAAASAATGELCRLASLEPHARRPCGAVSLSACLVLAAEVALLGGERAATGVRRVRSRAQAACFIAQSRRWIAAREAAAAATEAKAAETASAAASAEIASAETVAAAAAEAAPFDRGRNSPLGACLWTSSAAARCATGSRADWAAGAASLDARLSPYISPYLEAQMRTGL